MWSSQHSACSAAAIAPASALGKAAPWCTMAEAETRFPPPRPPSPALKLPVNLGLVTSPGERRDTARRAAVRLVVSTARVQDCLGVGCECWNLTAKAPRAVLGVR